jgi:hypothetical protein
MNEYVVYLVTYSGDKLPKYYIGSTSENKIKNGYLGSIRSKKWFDIFNFESKNNKHLFSVTILSYHGTRKDALIEELRVQIERNVVKSKEYFNESFACINGFFGMVISDEQKKIIGKRTSEQHKNGLSYKLPPLHGKDNPMCGRTKEVVAINVLTNEKVRVSKYEFDNDVNLSGHTVGLVPVIEIKTGKSFLITKDVFKNSKNEYKHINKGFKHTDELKAKLSKMRLGFMTGKDWNGNIYRVHKDDYRVKNGEIGGISSKRWVITDINGNEYKTFNLIKFFKYRGLQYPRPHNIDKDGWVIFRNNLKKSGISSINGWNIQCLDK